MTIPLFLFISKKHFTLWNSVFMGHIQSVAKIRTNAYYHLLQNIKIDVTRCVATGYGFYFFNTWRLADHFTMIIQHNRGQPCNPNINGFTG